MPGVEPERKISGEIEIQKAFLPTKGSLKRLRNTVLFRLLFVSLVPMIVLFLYVHFEFRTTLEKRSKLQLQTIAAAHRDMIDRFIENKTLALSSLVDSWLISLPPTKPDIRKLHKVLQSIDDTILDVGVFDEVGNQVCYSGPFEFLEGKSYANENWFKTLSTSEKPVFVSDVYLGYRAQPHFIMAVRAERGRDRWFLRMTIDPEAFLEMVDDVRLIDGAHAFIVNRNGIFQSVPIEIGAPLTGFRSWKSMQTKKETGYSVFEGEGHLIAAQKETDHSVFEGEGHLIAAQRMTTVDWTLIVDQPIAAAYAPIIRGRWVVMVAILASFVVILVVSLLATTTLVKSYAKSEKNRAELIDQLIQAGKMSTMGEMAAGVAHEINNPLAIVLSEIGLMEDFLDPSLKQTFDRDQFLRRLNSIREEADRCISIIHKLLGFARRTKTTVDYCDLNKLVQNTVELIQAEFNLENIDIHLDLQCDLCEIRSDEGKIKQVLLNLLMNAHDAIGKDGVITVRTENDQSAASLIVRDTGCGISKEHLAQIFMPFFSTKAVGKGTGLGLSITHGIVSSLNGKIHVSSEPSRGTSFEVVLPISDDRGGKNGE